MLSFSTGTVHKLLNTAANGGLSFGEIFKNGVIEIYSGTRPSDANGSVSGTLLGRITVGGGAFTPGSPTNGLNFGPAANRAIDKASGEVWMFTGLSAGLATWFRHKGNAVDDGTASTSAPRIDGTISSFNGDATLSDTNIEVGKVYTFDKAAFSFSGT